MKQRHLNALLLALAGSLLAPAAAQAHEIWLARIHGQPTVMYGHEESDTDPYDPITISEARAYKNGKPEEVAIVRHYSQKWLGHQAPRETPASRPAWHRRGHECEQCHQ